MVNLSKLGVLQKALFACAALFLGTLALLFLAGLFLPDHFEVQRTREMKANRPRLHSLVNDLERWREWTTWGDGDEAIVLEYSDPSSGVGAWYAWRGEKVSSGRIQITASDPLKGVWYDMTFAYEPYPLKGALRYLGAGDALELEWSLRGELDGPLERALGPIIAWRAGADFDKNLSALAELLNRD